ncbi:Uncharacterized protein C11orf65,Uncharacterized protein C11orf65 homolog [Mytilus coruscus]|uniref:Uncharacterized protein C11orf65,Uncharacterized protein C11orf65 homolog n=1 Tax=Mytilus coruscus TaxID=42192 RepID=A0A6J8DT09_MYTCO|nr:Uncharacterized protein C11orf65,Uncharacterized protein C11orf65 homolog [Mytilus coruscus]
MNRGQEIYIKSDLEETSSSKANKLAGAPKTLRHTLLSSNPDSEEGRISAAIEIQRNWRGYNSRSHIYETINPKVSKTAVYSDSRHHIAREQEFDGITDEEGEVIGPPKEDRLKQYYNDYLVEMQESDDPGPVMSYEEFCALYIQNWWKKHREKLQDKSPVQQIQYVPPKPQPVQIPVQISRPRRPLTERLAATIIQKSWRRHIDIQVYRYYRDLINFKARGNPALMLRCINPNEAKLLDGASGVHVKFRLAGERFPPNIYYKIFTHRPIQDMCANSPKNYTVSTVKLQMAKDVHSNVRGAPEAPDKNEWYKRVDNNGWRLVSDRLIHHLMADPVTWETSNKKYEFNHDKLKRIQDVSKLKKQRKIDWMQKMYKDGMLKAKSDDLETINLIEGAAAGMVATVEKMGPDALEDWEVDELLDWTTSLNFDDYLSSWKEVATSANSEKFIGKWETGVPEEDKMRIFTSADPYEFSLSPGQSRYQSTQQSRNTPASSVSGRIPVN